MHQVVLSPRIGAVLAQGGLRLYHRDDSAAIEIPHPHGDILAGLIASGVIDVDTHHDTTRELLVALEEGGYLVPAQHLVVPGLDRWDRQVRYLHELTGHGVRSQRQLASSCVAVIGIGGVGGAVTDALARAGVGRLCLVDPDVVEPHNVARQPLFDTSGIHRPKIHEARRRLHAISPDTTVDGVPTRIERAVDAHDLLVAWEPDLVVLAADEPVGVARPAVGDACWQLGIPLVTACHQPPLVRVGPLVVPGHTACIECHEPSGLRPDEIARVRVPIPGVIGGDQMAGAWLSLLVTAWLAGIHDLPFVDRSLDIDLLSGTATWVAPQAACDRCAHRRADAA